MTADKQRIARHFSAALGSYEQEACVQQQIHQQLLVLLKQSGQQDFRRILEIGCGTGGLTRALCAYCRAEQWTLNDLCDTRAYLQPIMAGQAYRFCCGDGEQADFGGDYDLIASASAVQWFDDLQGFLARCAQALSPQGLLLIGSFGEKNLLEIKHLTGIGLNYPSLAQWRQWLIPHFEILHLSEGLIRRDFDSPQAVLNHLKCSGVTATHRQIWTKGRLQQFIQQYRQDYGNPQGGVGLSYAPLLVLARKKGE